MSWRDDLWPASFRGVEFSVRGDLVTGIGRRTVTHVLEQLDVPYVEDLGRAPRDFRLTCIAIGDNYMGTRDALVRAFEQAGPGQLIHPTWGPLQVQLEGKARLREGATDGGFAEFDVGFVQVEDESIAVTNSNPSATIAEKVEAATAKGIAAFNDQFDILKLSSTLALAGIRAMSKAAAWTYGVQSKVNLVFGAIDQVQAQVVTLGEGISALARDPRDFASAIFGAYGTLARTIVAIQRAALTKRDETMILNVARSFQATVAQLVTDAQTFTVPDEVPAALAALLEETPSRLQEKQNAKAVQDLIRCAGLVSACDAAGLVEFTSSEDALALRTILSDAFDAFEADSDTALFTELEELRATTLHYLTTLAESLPGAKHYTLSQTMPALVVAQELYGDARLEYVLVDANRIRNPLFVPHGMVVVG